MALTTEDLSKIKRVMNEVVDGSEERTVRRVETAVGELAIAAQKQFLALDARFEGIDGCLNSIDGTIEDMREDLIVVKDMVKDHSFRLVKLEHQK